jgi:CheY-like chemotaxis protein
MDGEVGVKSKIGEGSTFWIDLPTFSQDPEKNTLNQNFIEIEKSHTTLKILLVEDNEMNIRLISGLVKNININHEIMVTKLGNEALTLAISHQPDLILLDLRLSDTNGKEVLKALKQNESTQSISVIIISADADPMLLEELTRLGAEHYITKPINFNELMQIITNHSTIKGHE